MNGRQAGAPVGSQGLTPVGSPNRIKRRTAPGLGSPRFGSPQFPRTDAQNPESSAEPTRSTFAERIYQSTGRLRAHPEPGSSFGLVSQTPIAQNNNFNMHSPGQLSQLDLGAGSSADVLASTGSPAKSGAASAAAALRRAPPPPVTMSAPAVKPVKGGAVQASTSAIPATVIDLPSQRMYALAVLGLLVAWKLYDAISLSVDVGRTSFYLFVKWCLLDSAMWYGAWFLRIPRLSILSHTMYALIALSVFINLNLFYLTMSVLTLAVKPVAVSLATGWLRSVKSIPWLGPRLVGDSDLLIDSFELDEAHILGRHTIHILPHSLTHMNPQGRSFCIDEAQLRAEPWYQKYASGLFGHSGQSQTLIPILINGTHPDSISYAYTSFETGQRQLRTIKNTGALQMETNAVYPTLGNWVMATYYLPVSEVGAYEIFSVKDRKGLEFRTATQAPPTIVVTCPQAQLQWLDNAHTGDNFVVGSDGHASICQRIDQDHMAESRSTDDGLLQVVVEGYEPIEMTVVRLVNGHREVISLDGIQPQSMEAQPTHIETLNATQIAAIEKWSRFKTRKSAYTLSDTFLRPGEYVYKLESIRDAANHSVVMSGLGGKGIFDGNKAAEGKATSYMARIQVHRRPSAGWADALLNAELPLRLSDDRARKSDYALPLTLSGTGPWTVNYIIDNGDEVTQESKTFSKATDSTIDAWRPGTYHLLDVDDKFCGGQASRANITLVQAPKPAANVSSTPITAHECGGEIGALVELELTGRPPFAVHYRERNLRFPNSRPITRIVRTQQRRHSFKVMPDMAGTYELEFFRLEDDNYPSGQPMSATIEQAIHAQPSAKIDTLNGRISSRACMGEELELPVRLKGQGPWELVYNIVYENRRTSKTVSGITDESYTIALGAFDNAGEYTIELAQVKDGNQCARDLIDVSTVVTVREGGPRVGFQCPDNGIHVLDGEQAQMPINVAGEFPVEVQYHKVGDTSDHVHTATIRRKPQQQSSLQLASVIAYGPGEYELLAASDICAGTIDAQRARCSVHVEAKPSAWFVTDSLRRDSNDAHDTGIWRLHESCEGAALQSAFELGLSGSGPWKIDYRVDYWATGNARSGVPSFTDRTITHSLVVLQTSTLKPECCEPGLYRYTLLSVRDERYQKPQMLLAAHEAVAAEAGVTVVEHLITKSPLAELRAYSPDGTPLDTSSSSRRSFRRQPRSIKHCLAPGQSKSDGDAQTWAKLHKYLPVFRIEFEPSGKAPFQAWVEVFPASGPSEVVHLEDIAGYSQPITLPDHVASQIGRYHMRLVRTRDARGCEHQFVDPSEVGLGRADHGSAAIAGGIEIEYIEAPNARPASASPAANPSRNVCVGDVLAFELRGLNSWNVDYSYNSARRSTSVTKRLFRRIADVPGNFTLERVCHRAANECCSEFDDLSYAVHDIPRVLVSGGKDVYQDILEGDMVDIRLDLVGAPPFTFTWQRRSIDGAKVLESHTVKDLDVFSYTISAASEGTFEVTFVQDRYCQYPKA
ncbi:hypothetical protein IWW35_001255 [Coemansia sp. RSA 1878]|nr:hypothetical protein IWW35_001255 [Coemansia sp. RSA 1878]